MCIRLSCSSVSIVHRSSGFRFFGIIEEIAVVALLFFRCKWLTVASQGFRLCRLSPGFWWFVGPPSGFPRGCGSVVFVWSGPVSVNLLLFSPVEPGGCLAWLSPRSFCCWWKLPCLHPRLASLGGLSLAFCLWCSCLGSRALSLCHLLSSVSQSRY